MRKQRFMDQSSFICPVCENRMPLMRPHNKPRERGHIKDMWCVYCQAERKFVELKEYEPYQKLDGSFIYG